MSYQLQMDGLTLIIEKLRFQKEYKRGVAKVAFSQLNLLCNYIYVQILIVLLLFKF